jgi:hypothetical protein
VSTIENRILSYSIVSSSSDRLRSTIGGYYNIAENTTDALSVEYVACDGLSTSHVESGVADITLFKIESPYIFGIMSPQISTTSSVDLIFPSIKMPYRLVGNSDNITDDVEWKAMVIGGSYSTSSYPGLLSSTTIQKTNVVLNYPYEIQSIKSIDYKNYSSYQTIDFGYEYNYYFPKYQAFVRRCEHVLDIPNYYRLLSSYLGHGDDMSEEMLNVVNIEGEVTTEDVLFTPELTRYFPTYDLSAVSTTPSLGLYKNKNANFEKYVTDPSGSLFYNQLSSSTADHLRTRSRVQIFDSLAQERLFSPSIEMGRETTMPFMTKIEVPLDAMRGSTDFADMIKSSGWENNLLEYIKSTFVYNNNINTNPEFVSHDLITHKAALIDGNITNHTTRNSETYREVSLFSWLLNSMHSTPTLQPLDCELMGGQYQKNMEMSNLNNSYRYGKTLSTLSFLSKINAYIKSSGRVTFDNYMEDGVFKINDFLNLAANESYSEVLAFRITKHAGEQATQANALQDFIFYNGDNISDASDGDSLVFRDSQVKYGDVYTYSIYAYVLAYDVPCRYTDVRYSKKLASPEQIGQGYCLRFYDPLTENPVQELYSSGQPDDSVFTDRFSMQDNTAISESDNSFVSSPYQYLADFNVVMEPSIKIIEIPISSKTISVLDHPPVPVDLTAYQRMNNSNVIGFFAQVESFPSNVFNFPTVLTDFDYNYSVNYVRSNNLVIAENEKLAESSRSKITRLEVFRLSEKPTKITDFSQNQVMSKILNNDDKDFPNTACFYEERIMANQKYYYLFRFQNALGVAGHCSDIYEIELVDDGSYKYINIDTYSPEQLSAPTMTDPSLPFKKLIQLVPNSSQMMLDESLVDYSNGAYEEFDNMVVGTAEHSIFDKRFKIRLTSKKTGEKIDLNVTYRLKER